MFLLVDRLTITWGFFPPPPPSGWHGFIWLVFHPWTTGTRQRQDPVSDYGKPTHTNSSTNKKEKKNFSFNQLVIHSLSHIWRDYVHKGKQKHQGGDWKNKGKTNYAQCEPAGREVDFWSSNNEWDALTNFWGTNVTRSSSSYWTWECRALAHVTVNCFTYRTWQLTFHEAVVSSLQLICPYKGPKKNM